MPETPEPRPTDQLSGPIITILILALVFCWSPFSAETVQTVQRGLVETVGAWGRIYNLGAFIMLLGTLVLAIGPMGRARFGPEGEKPEFSFFAWLALLFGASVTASIAFMGVLEPSIHYFQPPPFFQVEDMSRASAVAGMAQSYFHWGPTALAIYVGLAIPLAHAAYNHDLPLRFSTAFYYILGRRVQGPLGHALDIFAVLLTLGALVTAAGQAPLKMLELLSFNFGLEVGPRAQFRLLGFFMVVVAGLLALGLNHGLKGPACLCLSLFMLLTAAIFVLGPTGYVLGLGGEAAISYLKSFIGLSLFYPEDPAAKAWVNANTSFGWACWMAWAPFVSIFIARVSKGRNVRTMVLTALGLISLLSCLWLTVAGGTALDMEFINDVDQNGVVSSLLVLFNNLPLSGGTTVLALAAMFLFFFIATGSGVFALAINAGGVENPNRGVMVSLALVLGVLAVVMAHSDTQGTVESATVILASPLAILLPLALLSAIVRMPRRKPGPEAEEARPPEDPPQPLPQNVPGASQPPDIPNDLAPPLGGLH